MLLLVALGQLGYEEVAAVLGISSGTVGSRLNRARKKLNFILTRRHSMNDLQTLAALIPDCRPRM